MSVLGVDGADVAMLTVAIALGVPLIRADMLEHRLPNRLSGALAVLLVAIGVFTAFHRDDFSRLLPMLLTGLAMAAVGYLGAVVSPNGFGLGDVKLLGVIGLAIGHLDPQLVVLWLLLLAVCTAGWLLLAPRYDRMSDRSLPWHKRHVAFGPPMIVAWWLVYVVLMAVGE